MSAVRASARIGVPTWTEHTGVVGILHTLVAAEANPTCSASDEPAKSGVQTHSALVATIVVLTVLLVIFAAALILTVWLLIRDHLSQPAVPSTALLKSNVTLQMANSETT